MNKNPSNKISRRSLLTSGGAALAGLGALPFIGAGVAQAMPLQADDEVIPWLDQMAENPVPQVIGNQLVWEKADTWITPNDKFFSIAHYGNPAISAVTRCCPSMRMRFPADGVPSLSFTVGLRHAMR